MGRRYSKKVYTKGLLSFYTWSLSEHYQFVYRGYRLAAEYRNGELLRSYVWHASSDLPAWVEMNGVKYRYVTDGNRNVRQLIGAMGAVAASYEYDGYGRLLSASGVMAEENPLRFSSEYSDTGTGLIYYNYRHYSPELGRWLRRDPIEEQGGINLYGTGNDFVNTVDMYGLALYAFDGTANDENDHTNVYIMSQHYRGYKYYERGVGNKTENRYAISRDIQGAYGELYLKGIAEEAANKYVRELRNDKSKTLGCELDVIGFSRGAITAIYFIEEILRRKDNGNSNLRRFEEIRFVGLFDPVVGDGKINEIKMDNRIGKVSVAYSYSEYRANFHQTNVIGDNVSGYYFSGGHADIGGGYARRDLANRTLEYMTMEGIAAGAPFVRVSPSYVDDLGKNGAKINDVDGLEPISSQNYFHQEHEARSEFLNISLPYPLKIRKLSNRYKMHPLAYGDEYTYRYYPYPNPAIK